MSSTPHSRANDARLNAVAEAAGSWDARLRAPDCSADDRRAYEEWRDSNVEHRLAFERLQGIVAGLRDERSRAELRGIRDAALAMAEGHRRRLRWSMAAGMAAVSVAAALWLAGTQLGWWGAAAQKLYTTGVGERTSVTLEDGSTVELNSRSIVEINFTPARRALNLIEGQAVFHVAKDSQRPFSVHARDREVLALGTVFDVKLEPSAMRVTLLDGKVSVTRSDDRDEPSGTGQPPAAEPVVLLPGQQLVVATEHGMRSEAVRPIDTDKVTGWRQGRVFMDDMRLADAVAEMNRHSVIHISIEDASLEDLRVNGMFRAGEQQVFASALESYFPIEIRPRGDNEIMLRSRR